VLIDEAQSSLRAKLEKQQYWQWTISESETIKPCFFSLLAFYLLGKVSRDCRNLAFMPSGIASMSTHRPSAHRRACFKFG
jgi:hypothetical protein